MKKRCSFAVCALVAVIVTVMVCIAAGKSNYGLEGDEVFSFLSSSSKGGFKGICFLDDQTWYDADYFADALTATGQERFNVKMVVENQAMDVHPPLFYLCLNFICSVFEGRFSRWFGIGLNIFFLILLEGCLYLLLQYFLKNPYLSLFLSTVFCCSRLSVNMVLFIRMYVLLMVFVVLQSWIHLRLYDRMGGDGELPIRQNPGTWVCLAVTTIMGALTHYYFLIYQVLIAAVLLLVLWRQKKWKAIGRYVGVMAVSGVVYLCLYPAALNHLFFKYRGRDAVHKFLKEGTLLKEMAAMFETFDRQLYKRMLLPLLLFLTAATIFLAVRKKVNRSALLRGVMLAFPSVVYFYVVSKASPFVTIRYVSPVAPVIFAAVAVWAVSLVRRADQRAVWRWGSVGICAAAFLTSFYFFTEPIKEAYFEERKEVVDSLAEQNEYCMYITGDEYNWKMWEEYVIYPQFKGLFFIDGREQKKIVDEKVRQQEQMVIFMDKVLDYDDTIAYLKEHLQMQNYEKVYDAPYTYIIRGY